MLNVIRAYLELPPELDFLLLPDFDLADLLSVSSLRLFKSSINLSFSFELRFENLFSIALSTRATSDLLNFWVVLFEDFNDFLFVLAAKEKLEKANTSATAMIIYLFLDSSSFISPL